MQAVSKIPFSNRFRQKNSEQQNNDKKTYRVLVIASQDKISAHQWITWCTRYLFQNVHWSVKQSGCVLFAMLFANLCVLEELCILEQRRRALSSCSVLLLAVF